MNRDPRDEIRAWLGPALADTSAQQIDDLTTAAAAISARIPDPDLRDHRETALTTAYRLIAEQPDDVVKELADTLRRAREAEAHALTALQQAALTLVDPTGGKGARGLRTIAGFAQRAGLDRSTVIDWINKPST